MKKNGLIIKIICSTILVGGTSSSIALAINKRLNKASAYDDSTLPTRIDLNAPSDNTIRNYYASLNSLSDSEKQGTNLLKNLKAILKTNQIYYAYDGTTSGKRIWQMYEITDRDWSKSPASDIPTYNSTTNVIENYAYGSSYSKKGTNPYLHALYVHREKGVATENEMRAWQYNDKQENNHGGNKEWYIDREHIWPKSQGFESTDADTKGGARGDPMHLWPGDSHVNSALHNNNLYGYVDTLNQDYTDGGSKYTYAVGNYLGKALNLNNSNSTFEPQDEDKGDIARAIFYMVARYNYYSGSDSDGIDSNNPNLELVQDNTCYSSYTSSTTNTGKMGILSDLLNWNRIDPPDEFEIRRNNLLFTNYTNNRNPFIDFPQWADYIWGTATYNGRNLVSYNSTPTGYAKPLSDALNGEGEESTDTNYVFIDKSSLNLIREDVDSLTATSSDSSNITWTTSDADVVSLGSASTASGVANTITAVGSGTATITASSTIGGNVYSSSCKVTVKNSSVTPIGDTYDVIDKALTGAKQAYTNWTATVSTSEANYSGNSAGGYSSVQLRATLSSGIVQTKSGGLVAKATINWNSNTANDRYVTIYGKNTAYDGPSDLYDSSTRGDNLGTIVCGTSTSLDIVGDYKYIGILANSSIYCNDITISYAEQVVTSISATCSKSFLVGEQITHDDISVKDNYDNDIEDFELENDGYMFTYADAPSGGTTATKTFKVTYESVATTITVNVSREAYTAPSNIVKTLATDEFSTSSLPTSSSSKATGDYNIGGIVFSVVNAYVHYTSQSLRFGQGKGSIQTKNELASDLVSVNVDRHDKRSDFVQYISNDGTNWVTYTNGSTITGSYRYFKLAYTQSSTGVNSTINSITITMAGAETAITLSNYLMITDTNNQCLSKLDGAISIFNKLSKDNKASFMTSDDYVIATARERFEAWLLHEGKSVTLSDGDYVIESTSAFNFNTNSSNSQIMYVVLIYIGIVSITGSAFFLLKRKKKTDK